MPVGTPVIHLDQEQQQQLFVEYYADRGSEVSQVVRQPDGSVLIMLEQLPSKHVQRSDRADHTEVHVVDDHPEKIGRGPVGGRDEAVVDEDVVVISTTDDYEIRQGEAKSTDWVTNPNAPRHKLDSQERVDKRRERMLRVQAEQEAEQALLDKGVSPTAIQRKYRRMADE